METMPRPRPPHLQREVTRHGQVVWYFRIKGHSKRVRLRAAFGSPEFDAEYQAAISGAPRRQGGPLEGTLAWLIARYRETTAWQGLSLATRRQRENIFRQVLSSAGDQAFSRITNSTIEGGRDRRSSTPSQARHFLDAMRGLFRWAVKAKMIKADPTSGVRIRGRAKTEGIIPWKEDHVAAYERRWPIGTRQRVWLDVLLYTGLRRGDAVRFGRQHIRDGIGTIKTEKTGTEVTLPILPVLAETLASGPCGDLAFIAGESGQPLTKEISAICFTRRAAPPACLVLRMAFARSRRRARPMLARR